MLSPKSPTFVVGFDFSEHSTYALDQALRMAGWSRGAKLIVVCAAVPNVEYNSGADKAAAHTFQRVEKAVRGRMEAVLREGFALGEPNVAIRVTAAHPAQALKDIAYYEGADLIVVGEGGQSALSELLLGSVSRGVVRDGPCSVLVCRPRADESVPQVEPPPAPGQSSTLGRRHTYHYESRVGQGGVNMPLLYPTVESLRGDGS